MADGTSYPKDNYNGARVNREVYMTDGIFQQNDELMQEIDNNPEQLITREQAYNEAIIRLLVLFYQIDGKVTLTEQDFFENVLEKLDWRSGVAITAFVTSAIHQARVAIDSSQAREFLFALANGLSFDAAQALEYAMDITEVDGVRSEDELELLALLSNRVLARGLGI